jgi:DNA-binding transcriptional ArsR family regulator
MIIKRSAPGPPPARADVPSSRVRPSVPRHPPAAARRSAAVQLDAGGRARLREALIAVDAVVELADTFRVLGDATRVRILDALSNRDLCVGDLATLLGLTESAVSHQLGLLRGRRLVRARRAGRRVFYALDDEHIVELFGQGLRHVEEAVRAGGRRP